MTSALTLTAQEIADLQGVQVRTVERALFEIADGTRATWCDARVEPVFGEDGQRCATFKSLPKSVREAYMAKDQNAFPF